MSDQYCKFWSRKETGLTLVSISYDVQTKLQTQCASPHTCTYEDSNYSMIYVYVV